MTAVDSEIRSRYLALALDARRIMDVLVPFAEHGRRDQALDASVKDVMAALNSLGTAADVNAVHGPFESYEQVLTVEEIRTEEERQAVIEDLKRILDLDESGDKREPAMRVLQFLFALESRALQHYHRPVASGYAR
jgi:hypothetical protein